MSGIFKGAAGMRVRNLRVAVAAAALAITGMLTTASAVGTQQATAELRAPDVIYVPTPQEVVDAMLALANVTPKDVVYDLGSGDGRIPITAAQKYGARAIGIDIDPERIKEANQNLAKANVGDRVRFLNQDLFETDISEANVVTLYLRPDLNLKLMPKLKSLRKGTRIVSHSFNMGSEWPPEKTQDVNGRTIYYWTIP
jgi:16S rRNA G966 N2-methylase RsmD